MINWWPLHGGGYSRMIMTTADHSTPALHSTWSASLKCNVSAWLFDYLFLTLVCARRLFHHHLPPHHLSGSLRYSSCNSLYISHKLCKLIRKHVSSQHVKNQSQFESTNHRSICWDKSITTHLVQTLGLTRSSCKAGLPGSSWTTFNKNVLS